jgi:hypothetical protein
MSPSGDARAEVPTSIVAKRSRFLTELSEQYVSFGINRLARSPQWQGLDNNLADTTDNELWGIVGTCDALLGSGGVAAKAGGCCMALSPRLKAWAPTVSSRHSHPKGVRPPFYRIISHA